MVIKARHYAFTVQEGNLNGKFSSLMEWTLFARDRTAGIKYMVWQIETAPSTGTLHVQGFLTWQGQKTPATTANHFGGIDKECFQKMNKNATPWDNKVYCTKEGGLPGSQFEYGDAPVPGEKPAADESRLDAFIRLMQSDGFSAAFDNDPSTYVRSHSGLEKAKAIYAGRKIPPVRKVTVYVCYGASGSGKSYWANNFDTPENTFAVPDIKVKERMNLDGYDGQRTLIIEDYDGAIEFRSLLRLLDVYKAQFNTKGGMVYGAWDTVILTSNLYPAHWYDDRTDPWGLEEKGPLQRRIHHFLEFKGSFEKGTGSVSLDFGEFVETSRLPKRTELEAEEKSQESPETIVPTPEDTDASSSAVGGEEWGLLDFGVPGGQDNLRHSNDDWLFNGELGDGLPDDGQLL